MDTLKESKLLEVLSALSKRQRDDLLYFIKIPSLNHSENEIEVCKILLDLIHEKKINRITKDGVIEKVLFDKKDVEDKWNYITSGLLKSIYKYLLFKLSPPNEMPYGYRLLEFFREKNAKKNYYAHHNKLSKNTNLGRLQDKSHYHYYHFLLARLKVEDTRHIRKESKGLLEYLNYFDDFCNEHQLRILCELINRKEIINFDNPSEKIRKWEQRSDLAKHPHLILRIFYNIFKMLTAEKESEFYYFQVRNMILKKENNIYLSKKDIYAIYEYLMNFCIIKLNQGNESFSHEYLSYIKSLQNINLLLSSNFLSPQKFKNIITIGLISKETEWVENFLTENQNSIKSKYKNDILLYNSANIEFHKGDFDKAMELLSTFHSFDTYYQIGCEKLLLKIFFEKKYIPLLNDKLISFSRMIKNKSILSETNKELLLNFVKYLKILLQKKNFELDDLIGKIPVTDYFWFKKKLGDN